MLGSCTLRQLLVLRRCRILDDNDLRFRVNGWWMAFLTPFSKRAHFRLIAESSLQPLSPISFDNRGDIG